MKYTIQDLHNLRQYSTEATLIFCCRFLESKWFRAAYYSIDYFTLFLDMKVTKYVVIPLLTVEALKLLIIYKLILLANLVIPRHKVENPSQKRFLLPSHRRATTNCQVLNPSRILRFLEGKKIKLYI